MILILVVAPEVKEIILIFFWIFHYCMISCKIIKQQMLSMMFKAKLSKLSVD